MGDSRAAAWRTGPSRRLKEPVSRSLPRSWRLLHDLAFDVLAGAGSSRLLIERFAISCLPSAALLLRPVTRKGTALPWNLQLVAFGDPQPTEQTLLPADEHWSRLPDSARELRSVATALRGRAEIHSGPGDLKRYLAGRRTSTAPLLHISSHAAVDLVDPNRSRILFTPEAGSPGSEYLFWREVQDLPLPGVELATLSACETEGGKMVRGEGIQSFSRAFLAAGAAATVTTLWRVADRPTSGLMPLFYRRLAQGESKAEALRSAKLALARSGSEWSAPRYWAAFVLNGDGQTPVSPVLSWVWLIVPLVAALAALAAVRYLAENRERREYSGPQAAKALGRPPAQEQPEYARQPGRVSLPDNHEVACLDVRHDIPILRAQFQFAHPGRESQPSGQRRCATLDHCQRHHHGIRKIDVSNRNRWPGAGPVSTKNRRFRPASSRGLPGRTVWSGDGSDQQGSGLLRRYHDGRPHRPVPRCETR